MTPAARRPATAAQRLTSIESALSELGDIVANLPTEGEARRLRRVQRQIRALFILLLIPVVASTFFIVTAVVKWDDTKHALEQNRRGISCELGELFEHRVTNQAVHDRMAAALNVDPTPPTPLPPRYSAETLTELCAPFFPTAAHE